MPLIVVVGMQWGDEGKGKIVDLLSEKADVVARWNGGANAGHTFWVDDKKYVTHLLPSGLLQRKVCVLGAGMVVDPQQLLNEIDDFKAQGIDVSPEQVMLSHMAHIVLPTHKALDEARERARGKNAIGTTRQGISPAYQDKESGRGLQAKLMLEPFGFGTQVCILAREHNLELARLGCYDLRLDPDVVANQYQEFANQLKQYVCNTSSYLEGCLAGGKTVLAEGAQGALLDVKYGTVPYVTRSSTIARNAPYGLGVDQKWIDQARVIGIAKCFQTRVGEGPMPTEITDDQNLINRLRGEEGAPGAEYGATTGRPRRVGWLDLPLLRYAVGINDIDELVLTKLDVLSGLEFVKVCIAYKLLGEEYATINRRTIANLKDYQPLYRDWFGWKETVSESDNQRINEDTNLYIRRVEEAIGVPVTIVSVGTDRNQVIIRSK
jgi:adenylosuccinate synthase